MPRPSFDCVACRPTRVRASSRHSPRRQAPDYLELHDPIEDEPALSALIARAKQQAEAALSMHEDRDKHGFCHVFWSKKADILREEYGIVWYSPADMNPDVMYD
jgi:hypothetical protein